MCDMPVIRRASPTDAASVARLLHEFNAEFETPTPGPAVLEERIASMLETGEATVLLAGDGPDGLAQLSFRRYAFDAGLVATLEELYVAPDRRGEGLGRALLEGAMEASRDAGAASLALNTSEDDKDAIALYERNGFTNREGGPDGPRMLFYECEL
jgi:GNAT superfamily N-acetyltransferase